MATIQIVPWKVRTEGPTCRRTGQGGNKAQLYVCTPYRLMSRIPIKLKTDFIHRPRTVQRVYDIYHCVEAFAFRDS